MVQDQPRVDTSAAGNDTNPAQTVAEGKGKGKAADIAPQDLSMGEEDSSSDEETGAEDEVCAVICQPFRLTRLIADNLHSQKKSVCLSSLSAPCPQPLTDFMLAICSGRR